MASVARNGRAIRIMVSIRAILLLVLLSLASPQPARPNGMPEAASPMPSEPTAYPPTSPELDKAIRLADETIRMHGATKLSDLIDISAPKLTCQECNCTYGYTSQMPFGDVVYSINFLLSFVESVAVMGTTVQVKGRNNTIVVTTDRKLEAMPVRDVRSYYSFEIYLGDQEAAEKVTQHLTAARGLCIK